MRRVKPLLIYMASNRHTFNQSKDVPHVLYQMCDLYGKQEAIKILLISIIRF